MLHSFSPLLALSLPSVPSAVAWVFAANTLVAVFSGMNVILQQNPIYSALFLVANFCALAVYYLLLDAQFLAVVQIIVYAGAIMVLFLFVITLLAPGREETGDDHLRVLQVPALLLALLLGVAVAVALMFNDVQGTATNLPTLGTVQVVGDQIFHNFLFPFEVTSLLLLAAMLGAVVLAKRRIDK